MSFKPSTVKRPKLPEYTTVTDVRGRCDAAARFVARGKNWSDADREDISAEVFFKVWQKADGQTGGISAVTVAGRASSVLHGPKVTYTKYSAQKSLDTVPQTRGSETGIRSDLCRWEYIVGLASTERRSIERTRERDHQEARLQAEERPTFNPLAESQDCADETGSTPRLAAWTAVDMGRSLRVIDTRVTAGPIWTTLYAAARAVESPDGRMANCGGLDRETVAAELGLEPATVRQHIARGTARIAARNPELKSRHDYAEALHLPDGGIALKPSRSRTKSADLNGRVNGLRDHIREEDHAEVTTRRMPHARRNVRRWETDATVRPDWANDLAPRTSARLTAYAKIRQARARGDARGAAGTLDAGTLAAK